MADLTVPKEHQPILNRIRTMPEAAVRALVAALEASPGAVPSIQGLSPEDAETIKDVLMDLYRVRGFVDMELPEFVSNIAASLQETEGFPSAEMRAFEERLTRLLNIESVSVGSRAASLKIEYDRRFCTARLMTDARPIYGADPAMAPSAVMIMHTLRISYHDDTSELREFYVAMDADDVATLRTLLNRADVKAKSLGSVFAAANVKIVAP